MIIKSWGDFFLFWLGGRVVGSDGGSGSGSGSGGGGCGGGCGGGGGRIGSINWEKRKAGEEKGKLWFGEGEGFCWMDKMDKKQKGQWKAAKEGGPLPGGTLWSLAGPWLGSNLKKD